MQPSRQCAYVLTVVISFRNTVASQTDVIHHQIFQILSERIVGQSEDTVCQFIFQVDGILRLRQFILNPRIVQVYFLR